MDVARLRPQLEDYMSHVDLERVTAAIATGTGLEPAVARSHLITHIGEAQIAMQFVGPVIEAGMRVLEVGSGIGLFAGFLRSIDIEVTELEPVGMGFQFIGEARAALADYTHPSRHLDIGVEDLQRTVHGSFDLIFSLNVLEHVADWRTALQRCASVMSDGGQMMHAHPNYTIPYEPHFSVPLVPFRPSLTSLLLPDRISDTDTWRSLNWITARGVQRWCRSNSLAIEFRAGVLAEQLDRLTTDELFRDRHEGFVYRAAGLARRLRLDRLLTHLPNTLNTPVEYSIRRIA